MRLQSVVSKSPIVFLCVVALQIADCSDLPTARGATIKMA